MILITTYYETENITRNNEIKKCLVKNFENKYIDKIYSQEGIFYKPLPNHYEK
jgi:hypothetical protein